MPDEAVGPAVRDIKNEIRISAMATLGDSDQFTEEMIIKLTTLIDGDVNPEPNAVLEALKVAEVVDDADSATDNK